MALRKIDWDTAYSLLSPHSYGLLATLDSEGRPNVMGISWWAPASYDPLMVTVSVAKTHYSRWCLEAHPEFALCFPSADQARAAWTCGEVSGRSRDKFAFAGLEGLPARHIPVPLVAGSVVAFECRVERRLEVGDHVLHVAEVLDIHGDVTRRAHLYAVHVNRLAAIDLELNVQKDLAGKLDVPPAGSWQAKG